jgi:DNA-binding NtrC family response regulator
VPIVVPPLREREEDISILFRKFASDFSDNNKIEPVRLSDDAKNELKKYRFPGNIRELKNLAEQISVLEIERNISVETIRKYIPETSNLPTLSKFNSESNDENYNERDILYKILFDLKNDVTEMKKIIDNILNSDEKVQLDNKKSELLEENNILIRDKEIQSDNSFQEVTEVEIDTESLSIEKKERELIIKALKKNRNKRKHAAKDLGISERTLYRKIKHYNLESI